MEKKIRARKPAYLQQSCILLAGAGPIDKAVSEIQDLAKEGINTANVRQLGSASLSLALHASGAADLFYARNISICSLAAGLLIASEAGARIKKSQQDDMNIERVISVLAPQVK